MSRKGIAIWIVLMTFFSFFVIIIEVAPRVIAYTPHAPINIDGDDDFSAQAALEGWPGDGTGENPYIIEGYEITVNDTHPWHQNAIDIMSTEAHFIVRDSRIIAGTANHLIFFNNVKNGRIENCIIENGSLGIYIWAGGDNSIINNTFMNNNLLFWQTIECTFIGNEFIEGGFEISGSGLENWNSHYIDTSNTVNSKPIYYWTDRNGGTVPADAGQVILVNCTNVVVENQVLTNSSNGIIFGYSSNNNIKWNTIDSNNKAGIDFWLSSENSITNNNISSNSNGFYFQHSNNNSIQFNEIKSNGRGISFFLSSKNFINGNNISSNMGDGIYIHSSSHSSSGQHISFGNTIINNSVADNWDGINIENSNLNNITDNIFTNNWYGIYIDHSNENKIIDNIADSNKWSGLYMENSSGNTLRNNIVMNNYYGIRFEDFSNGTRVIANNISNNYYGIDVYFSYDNIFHHNNIINNTVQLDQNDSTNIWDDGDGEGNYWSDYTGNDTNGDGVGDTDLPHHGVDYFPLVEPVDIANYRGPSLDNGDTISTEPWFLSSIILLIILIFIILLFVKRMKKRNISTTEINDQINQEEPPQ